MPVIEMSADDAPWAAQLMEERRRDQIPQPPGACGVGGDHR
jgi:hypothetical protein